MTALEFFVDCCAAHARLWMACGYAEKDDWGQCGVELARAYLQIRQLAESLGMDVEREAAKLMAEQKS